MDKKQKESKLVNVAINEEDMLALKNLALIINTLLELPEDNNISVNSLVSIAIREYVIKLVERYKSVNINKEEN